MRRPPPPTATMLLVALLAAASLSRSPVAATPLSADTAWTARGLAVCGAPNAQNAPGLAPDGSGGVFLVWEDARVEPDTTHIYAQHLLSDGTRAPGWPADGVPVCVATGIQTSPQVVGDGSGGLIAVWEDDRAAGVVRLFGQHLDATGAVAAGWIPDGRALCAAPGVQHAPRLVSDGAGGAVVVWEDYRRVQSLIAAQHVRGDGGFAPGWPDSGVLLAPAPGGQVGPVVATDAIGGAIVAWTDGRNTVTSSADIYAQHVQSDGSIAAGWPPAGLAACGASQAQQRPAIVADEAGGAFIAWMDPRDAVFYVYVQHLDPDGSIEPGWIPDGFVVAGVGYPEFDPALATDGLGRVLVAWVDTRGGAANADIYAQRLAPDGAPEWAPGGVPVCTAPGDQLTPRLVDDLAGGAIIGWQDGRFGPSARAYAQRVTSAGSVSTDWPVDGRALADTNLVIGPPQMIADGSGGAILAWGGINLALFAGTPDIYAARVLGNGVVPVLASALAPEARLDRVRLRWWTPHSATPVEVERRDATSAWRPRATIVTDGTGMAEWEDRDVAPGATYGWRLRVDGEPAGEVWATVPRGVLGITRVWPQPALAEATIALALARPAPARLALFDLAGRRRWERAVAGIDLTPRVAVETGTLEPGVYVLRLTQGAETARAKLVVTR